MTVSFTWILSSSLALLAPEGEAEGSVSLGASGADASADADADGKEAKKKKKKAKKNKRKDQKWIRRWAPERNMWELGLFGGVMFPHPRLELFESDFNLPDQGFRPYDSLAPEGGLRVAYFPSRFLGLEVEGAVVPTAVDNGESAFVYAARGHLMFQIPFWSITPFVVAGPTGLGVVSDRSAVGNDIDLGFHYGGGVKIFMSRYSAIRLDVRDTMTARRGVGESVVHSPEVLLGLSLTLGRKNKEPAKGPLDTDGDGILDPDDECVDVPGVAEYNGCPVPDTDGDGILDPDDKCVNEPETKNGYQDEDGCPDEVPKEVAKFTGAIEGIFFDTNKATIRKKSMPVLKKALKVLQDFPHLRLEISGHTDDRGNDDHNMDLSKRRADAVREFFVSAGLKESRFETRGAGETEPRESNKTKKGRAKNRRIEFKLLQR